MLVSTSLAIDYDITLLDKGFSAIQSCSSSCVSLLSFGESCFPQIAHLQTEHLQRRSYDDELTTEEYDWLRYILRKLKKRKRRRVSRHRKPLPARIGPNEPSQEPVAPIEPSQEPVGPETTTLEPNQNSENTTLEQDEYYDSDQDSNLDLDFKSSEEFATLVLPFFACLCPAIIQDDACTVCISNSSNAIVTKKWNSVVKGCNSSDSMLAAMAFISLKVDGESKLANQELVESKGLVVDVLALDVGLVVLFLLVFGFYN